MGGGMEPKVEEGGRLQSLWDRWGWLLLILVAMLLFVGVWTRARGGATKGQDLSAVAFADASGAKHTLAEYRGRVLVVDLWATWCPPCRASLPELAGLQARADGRYAVLPISIDERGFADIEPFFKAHRELRVASMVPLDLGPLEPVGVIPTTILVDARGRVLSRWSGYHAGRAAQELKAVLYR